MLLSSTVKGGVTSFLQRTLEREVRGCQVLIIWTDCDREGENIGFEVIEVCQSSMFLATCIFLKFHVSLSETLLLTVPVLKHPVTSCDSPDEFLTWILQVHLCTF